MGKRLLSAIQCSRARLMMTAGATRDETAALVGITRSRLDTRLRDQLADLRVGQGRRELDRSIQPDPTPAEIAERSAEVRAMWSESETDLRRQNFSGPLCTD